jgi:hypothetical protein
MFRFDITKATGLENSQARPEPFVGSIWALLSAATHQERHIYQKETKPCYWKRKNLVSALDQT